MTHKQMSSKGGKAGTGAAKARTSEQARAAVEARWAKAKRARSRNARPGVRKGETVAPEGRKDNAKLCNSPEAARQSKNVMVTPGAALS